MKDKYFVNNSKVFEGKITLVNVWLLKLTKTTLISHVICFLVCKMKLNTRSTIESRRSEDNCFHFSIKTDKSLKKFIVTGMSTSNRNNIQLQGVDIHHRHPNGPSSTHSKTEVLKSIDIGCAGVDAHNNCRLKRRTNVSISTNFTSNFNTNKVPTVVHGILNGVAEVFLHLLSKDGEEDVRFNGVTEDACISNVNHCNITKGEIIQYTNTLPVDRKYPLLRLTVKWEVRDDQNNNLVCIKIPVAIVN
ncbi:NPC2 [Mytilus coruscus]|uniref:NPC2 n=1 Tax=Mytilus coruscus TaxID=42192 RepID=A0A6J8AYV7_MYTCO|nr:NPC2 [Mytilus coruscus]